MGIKVQVPPFSSRRRVSWSVGEHSVQKKESLLPFIKVTVTSFSATRVGKFCEPDAAPILASSIFCHWATIFSRMASESCIGQSPSFMLSGAGGNPTTQPEDVLLPHTWQGITRHHFPFDWLGQVVPHKKQTQLFTVFLDMLWHS